MPHGMAKTKEQKTIILKKQGILRGTDAKDKKITKTKIDSLDLQSYFSKNIDIAILKSDRV